MNTKNFTENFNFKDDARKRRIAVAVYFNELVAHSKKIPVVFLNHGGTSSSTEYSYLANFLASKGYAVICIQHNFIGDEPHSLEKFNQGILKETRKPIWELWSGNIMFVIDKLKALKPDFDLDKFIVAGHSTGGDVSMFFATQHPELVSNIISLDGRRCPFPRNASCRVLLLQATDTTTDDGVIPSEAEEHELTNVSIIKLENSLHNDYSDNGPDDIKRKVCSIVEQFLDSVSK
jgi:predicted dienelactone hydrolase